MISKPLYLEDVKKIAALDVDWNRLSGKHFLISGASGMIGSFLVDVLMYKNRSENADIRIVAPVRNAKRARARFAAYEGDAALQIVQGDINEELGIQGERTDFVIHAASNTHPLVYANDPIGTVTTNIVGTNNLLRYAAENGCERFVFLSSVEIYGENRGDTEYFAEDYLGYIDCNTLRAGYPESKRCGEALCQAYIRQKKLDIVIPRLARSYGPTMLKTDTKALSQFIANGVKGEDIVLKSEGTQFYSYTYAADAVSGILYCLLYGECGGAYNIADFASDITLRDLAGVIAEISGTKVIFQLPDAAEAAGFSKATKAVMNASKIKKLGWKPLYDIKTGLQRTLRLLKEEEGLRDKA